MSKPGKYLINETEQWNTQDELDTRLGTFQEIMGKLIKQYLPENISYILILTGQVKSPDNPGMYITCTTLGSNLKEEKDVSSLLNHASKHTEQSEGETVGTVPEA